MRATSGKSLSTETLCVAQIIRYVIVYGNPLRSPKRVGGRSKAACIHRLPIERTLRARSILDALRLDNGERSKLVSTFGEQMHGSTRLSHAVDDILKRKKREHMGGFIYPGR